MPTIAYFAFLTPEDRIRIRIVTDRGVVLDFTAQYEMIVGSRFRAVVRYDPAHGQGHRDILDPDGRVIQKDWLPSHWTMKQWLDYGVHDLRQQWRTYREAFTEQLP